MCLISVTDELLDGMEGKWEVENQDDEEQEGKRYANNYLRTEDRLQLRQDAGRRKSDHRENVISSLRMKSNCSANIIWMHSWLKDQSQPEGDFLEGGQIFPFS